MSYDYYHALEAEKIIKELLPIINQFKVAKKSKRIEEIKKELGKSFVKMESPEVIRRLSLLYSLAEILNLDEVKEGIRSFWIDKYPFSIELKDWEAKQYTMPKSEISNSLGLLPVYSAYLHLTFRLTKPYISKDDDIFYITENPIRKDKVSKEPMVSGSTWKGNLRWTAQKNLEIRLRNKMISDEDAFKYRLILFRLFGVEKEVEKEYLDGLMPGTPDKFQAMTKPYLKEGEGFEGRLRFFSTYFNRIDLEVINPHKREHRAGIQPIYYEVVPGSKNQRDIPGDRGVFQLLYVPYDLIGKNGKDVMNEVKEDWEILSEAIHKMMTEYGFGAKKLAGQGIAESKIIDGAFQLKDKPEVELRDISFSNLKSRIIQII